MKHYNLHKRVHAEPISRDEYNCMQNCMHNCVQSRVVPFDADPTDEGMQEGMQEGMHVVYNRGTELEWHSWSPRCIFDEDYSEVGDLTYV